MSYLVWQPLWHDNPGPIQEHSTFPRQDVGYYWLLLLKKNWYSPYIYKYSVVYICVCFKCRHLCLRLYLLYGLCMVSVWMWNLPQVGRGWGRGRDTWMAAPPAPGGGGGGVARRRGLCGRGCSYPLYQAGGIVQIPFHTQHEYCSPISEIKIKNYNLKCWLSHVWSVWNNTEWISLGCVDE